MLTVRTESGKFQYPGNRLLPEEMDDIDRRLILALCEDPRTSLRKLVSSIGISRQALNQRMRKLAEAGLFKTIKGEISMSYLDGIVVWIWGRSRAASLDKALDALGRSEFTARVAVAGGSELLVWGFLRHMSNLSAYVKFVREAADMPDVTVGLPCFLDGINPPWADGQPPKTNYRKLSALDLRIIAVLQKDSRMPIEEIAMRTGASPRTARRHIDVMRREGSLDYASPWDIPPGVDMVTIVHITLKKGADAASSAKRLLRIDPIHFVLLRQFSNLPGLLTGLVTSDRMHQIREILSEISEDEEVLAVAPNLIYYERVYDSWDYRLLTGKPGPSDAVGSVSGIPHPRKF